MILVGTSGYAYADWKGTFYPPGLPEKERLAFYARHFTALEVNFTYYRLPAPGQLAGIAARAGGKLTLTVKANREMTHTGKAGADDYRVFREAIEPLAEKGLFGCVLVQFPSAFRGTGENRETLWRIVENFRPFPVTAEFRHVSWAVPETFAALREHGVGFCAVDEPRLKGLFPPLAEVTSPIAYVRFHGRNARSWWKHKEPHERYDYLYKESQLQEWVPKIRAMERQAGTTFLFANNHYEGKAAVNAQMLITMTKTGSALES